MLCVLLLSQLFQSIIKLMKVLYKMGAQTFQQTFHNYPNPPADLKPMPIEQLLYWTYAKQLADKARIFNDRDAGPCGAGDSCYQLLRRDELGTRVDGGAGRLKVHHDAEAIDDALVEVAGRDLLPMVIHYARSGTQPDWMPGARPKFRAVLNARRKPKKIYDKNRKAIGCLVNVESSIEIIAARRRTYGEWLAVITHLAIYLQENKSLKSHWPLLPTLSHKPWTL